MFLDDLIIVKHQGKQFIKDLTKASLPEIFRGIPQISDKAINAQELIDFCPTAAILLNKNKLAIDLGKCAFCGDCQMQFPKKITFTNQYKMATNNRDSLMVYQGESKEIKV
ncbi:MAG: NADH:ubiquinone oxidoreductase, partial [Flavobacteriales bacterium CG11_big_fil_rev_8_21_14_0_20_35_7]